MKIYFAAPLFSAAEKEFNQKLTKKLEAAGFDVFLPQRDGVEKDRLPYSRMEPDARRQAMFELDRDEIMESSIFLYILDGRVPDEGAAVELGIAYMQKYISNNAKILIGLHTDVRAAFIGAGLNPMLKVPLDHIFDNEEAMLEFMNTLKKE